MAAVIIANLRRHRTDNSHAEGGDLHAIFPRYDVVHSGPLAKRAFFSGATTWNTVECAVTGSTFAMGKMGSDCLIDCIPLEEIESVRSAKAKDIDHKANNSKSAANVRLDLDLEDESAGQLMCFEISTSADGHNNGRKYQFRGSLIDGSDIQNWVSVIKAASKKARDEKEKKVVRSCSEIAVSQAQALRENRYVQLGFGIAICLSFILSVVSAEVRPEAGSVTFKVLDYCDWILTGIFVLELLVNFTADFFFTFFKSSWNLFDLVVVTGSIVASVQPSSDMYALALNTSTRPHHLSSCFAFICCSIERFDSIQPPHLSQESWRAAHCPGAQGSAVAQSCRVTEANRICHVRVRASRRKFLRVVDSDHVHLCNDGRESLRNRGSMFRLSPVYPPVYSRLIVHG